MLSLSVLDQSTIVTGRSPASSIQESLALARHCEALGYHRYWVAEHHNSESIAGTAPEILISAIAATTQRIRVGSAGIMLPHYAPLKVAEGFRVLEAIAPGRIDLGLGRAPGSDMHTAYALNPNADTSARRFPENVRDLMDWLDGRELIEGHPFRAVQAQPTGPGAPEVWILGSSDYGARVAAHFGLPYCFAHFITDGAGAREALDVYRDTYQPSERHPTPHPAITVWALAAPSEAEARRLFTSRELWRLGRDRGSYKALPSPEEADAYDYRPAERATIERLRQTGIYGTGPQVLAQLTGLAAHFGVEEIAVLTTVHDAEARRQSYSLLMEAARAAEMNPAETGSAAHRIPHAAE